ncbi:MAG: phage portal protein [Bacillota bacterium]
MALFDNFIKNKLKNLLSQSVYEYWIHSGVVNNVPDVPEEYIKQGYSGNTTVYSIINRIDAMRKQAVLKLYDANGKEIENHELLKYLDKVNAQLTTDDFISQLFVYWLTIGEFFVYKLAPDVGLNKGKVQELHMLPSADVEIIEGTIFEPIRGYRIEGNYNIELPYEAVYQGKKFNPNWNEERTLHGMSPLRAAAKTLSKLNQIEITEQKQFENQGAPYILFKENSGDPMQNRMTDPQRDEIIKKVKNAAKENNRGLPLVLKDKFGKLDLGQKLADMTVIESSKSGIIALCALYGMPAQLFGYGDTTYNNYNTAIKDAWTNCIIPNCSTVEQTFNECLINNIPEYKGLKFAFDYSQIEELQDGMETRVAWMNAAGWSGNEVRQATGKPISDNPLMDEPRIPMGVTFLSDYDAPLDEGAKDFGDYLDKK